MTAFDGLPAAQLLTTLYAEYRGKNRTAGELIEELMTDLGEVAEAKE